MTTDDPAASPPPQSNFKGTLFRVLAVQVVTLVLLWLLQMRYHA